MICLYGEVLSSLISLPKKKGIIGIITNDMLIAHRIQPEDL